MKYILPEKLDKSKLIIRIYIILNVLFFLTIKFRNHFKDHSDLLFNTYGDRVKHILDYNQRARNHCNV